jgi:uncharacterized protein
MAIDSQKVSWCLVRIYFNEDNLYNGHPLADYLLDEAQKAGVQGATIFRGVMGFGSHHTIHSTSLLRLTESLPLVMEIMDSDDQVMALVQKLKPALTECRTIRIPVEPLLLDE